MEFFLEKNFHKIVPDHFPELDLSSHRKKMSNLNPMERIVDILTPDFLNHQPLKKGRCAKKRKKASFPFCLEPQRGLYNH